MNLLSNKHNANLKTLKCVIVTLNIFAFLTKQRERNLWLRPLIGYNI